MAFKTLTIKEEVYKKLAARKREKESFSDLLERLAEKEKPDIMKFAGAWKDIPEEEFKKMEELRKNFREKFNKNAEERWKKILEMWKK